MGSVTRTQGLRFAVVSYSYNSFSQIGYDSCFGSISCLIEFWLLKVVARFNEIVTKQLLEGALGTFKNYSVQDEDIDVCSHYFRKTTKCDSF
jgi:hypothetical protein